MSLPEQTGAWSSLWELAELLVLLPASPSVGWKHIRPGRIGESGVEAGLWENSLLHDQLPFGTLALSLFLCFLGTFLLAEEENSLKMSSFLCCEGLYLPAQSQLLLYFTPQQT